MNDQEYFLGCIVLVATGEDKHLLLDGQQRLATATILLSVIRDFLATDDKGAAERTQFAYIAALNDATNTTSYSLQLNQYDRDFFRREIQDWPRDDGAPDATMESHQLIRKAKEFFTTKFQEHYRQIGDISKRRERALRLREVLTNHFSVVVVKSDDEDNAASVFETLNDRGVGLSTPDLLRSYLLRTADASQRDEVFNCWRVILEVEEEARVEDFIRHYWLSKHGDVKTRRLFREIKRALNAEGSSSLPFTRELRGGAVTYREIVAGRDDDSELEWYLQGIRLLNAKSLLPAVLSIYEVCKVNDRRRLVKALVALYVRCIIVGGGDISRLETVVFAIAKDLRRNSDVAEALERISSSAPSDDEFQAQFKKARIQRQGVARYILLELERHLSPTRETCARKALEVHVEHVYPRNPSSERWPNHDQMVDRIGNLTLLGKGLNTSAKNKGFAEKLESYKKSDFKLTRELASYASWSPNAVEKRQRKLGKWAALIWSVPSREAPEGG